MTDLPGSDEPGAEGFGALEGLLSQAMEMQQQLMDAQAAAAEQEVEGVAGGGAVSVRVTGGMEFRAVRIDPAAVDPDDVEMLQDLVLAALLDATARVQELQAAGLGGLGDLIGGMGGTTGFPGLGELGGPDQE